MKGHDYNILVTPDTEDGGFFAIIPDLEGCIGDGETPQDAVVDVLLAAESWLKVQAERGAEVPEPGIQKHLFEQMLEEREEYIAHLEAELAKANRELRKATSKAASRSGLVTTLTAGSFRAA